jgi:hypothetical protein
MNWCNQQIDRKLSDEKPIKIKDLLRGAVIYLIFTSMRDKNIFCG